MLPERHSAKLPITIEQIATTNAAEADDDKTARVQRSMQEEQEEYRSVHRATWHQHATMRMPMGASAAQACPSGLLGCDWPPDQPERACHQRGRGIVVRRGIVASRRGMGLGHPGEA